MSEIRILTKASWEYEVLYFVNCSISVQNISESNEDRVRYLVKGKSSAGLPQLLS